MTQALAGASTLASPKSLTKDLLPASYAKKAGFPKVAQKVSTTSSTGSKTCPHGAQEAFEDAPGKVALESEAVACVTASDAAALLKNVQSSTSAISARPPKQLGSSAIERTVRGTTYAIYWLRGLTVEAVSFAPDVAALSSSTSTTIAVPPITAAQLKILSSAALKQNGLIK
jgi:hypothetical protein